MHPNKDAILHHADECGLSAENIVFSVDAEGVDNADIYPLPHDGEAYMDMVDCMMGWAAESGAAVGFHFQPRGGS